MTEAKDLAALHWFGYGRWDAPYWFVGMEPGGDDEDDLSYASWLEISGDAPADLIDCKTHHDDWNRRTTAKKARWHDAGSPPIQTTWGPLIKTLLALELRSHEKSDIAAYQRDSWGRDFGDTAVLELSALHARNLSVGVERTVHRNERIRYLRARLDERSPRVVFFYGQSYRGEYERIAGAFNAMGYCWRGQTLCVVTVHPAYRFAPKLDSEYWAELGLWAQKMLLSKQTDTAEPKMPALPQRKPSARLAKPIAVASDSSEHRIMRGSEEVGRVIYDGWNVRVEKRLAEGGYAAIGAYERTRPHQFERKLGEIDSIFDQWACAALSRPDATKAAWRSAIFVPGFAPPPEAIRAGCAVLLDDGIEVARIYKALPNRAIWIDSAV